MRIRRVHIVASALSLAMAGVALPATVSAQTSIFAGVSVGVETPATGSFTQSASTPFRNETSRQSSDYRVPSGLFVGAEGGYMIRPWLGAAIGFTRFASKDTADYSLTLPNVLVSNAAVTRTGTTIEQLDHSERALHLSVVFVPQMRMPVDVKIFAGPSRIYVSQQLVDDLDITETIGGSGYNFTIDKATIGQNTPCACAWGFHVGADVSKYLRPNVGVGAMVRYARATVDLQNAARGLLEGVTATQEYVGGGFMIAGGIRYRFPSATDRD